MANLVGSVFDSEEDTLKGRYLTFLTDHETFGIEIRYVMEIIGIQLITEMPEMPDYMKGIINLRGRIIPVMDIRIRFSKCPREYDDRTCVIVTNFKGIFMGFIVDSVSEVLTIPETNISDSPSMCAGDSLGYVNKIGKVNSNTVILLLDCGKLLNTDEYETMGGIL